MRHQKPLTRIISAILTLALLCGLVPTTVFATQEDAVQVAEDASPKNIVDAVANPVFGLQSGVQNVVDKQEPRTQEELLSMDGITLTEDGKLASVKTSLLDTLSEEERDTLRNLMSVGTSTIPTATSLRNAPAPALPPPRPQRGSPPMSMTTWVV